jgi:hypothetical protein
MKEIEECGMIVACSSVLARCVDVRTGGECRLSE